MKRSDEIALKGVQRLVSECGWLAVLKAIAKVKPRQTMNSHPEVFTPEYVMRVYETWCEELETHPNKR